MRCTQCLLIALILSAEAARAHAADEACLTPDQRRAAITGQRAIPLAHAVRELKGRITGSEVVRAELCNHGHRLVYVLTVLAHDGKVTHANIDAASGAIIEAR